MARLADASSWVVQGEIIFTIPEGFPINGGLQYFLFRQLGYSVDRFIPGQRYTSCPRLLGKEKPIRLLKKWVRAVNNANCYPRYHLVVCLIHPRKRQGFTELHLLVEVHLDCRKHETDRSPEAKKILLRELTRLEEIVLEIPTPTTTSV